MQLFRGMWGEVAGSQAVDALTCASSRGERERVSVCTFCNQTRGAGCPRPAQRATPRPRASPGRQTASHAALTSSVRGRSPPTALLFGIVIHMYSCMVSVTASRQVGHSRGMPLLTKQAAPAQQHVAAGQQRNAFNFGASQQTAHVRSASSASTVTRNASFSCFDESGSGSGWLWCRRRQQRAHHPPHRHRFVAPRGLNSSSACTMQPRSNTPRVSLSTARLPPRRHSHRGGELNAPRSLGRFSVLRARLPRSLTRARLRQPTHERHARHSCAKTGLAVAGGALQQQQRRRQTERRNHAGCATLWRTCATTTTTKSATKVRVKSCDFAFDPLVIDHAGRDQRIFV